MKFSDLRRFFDDQNGAGMPEFSLVAGIFTVMLLGFIEAGMAAWSKNSVYVDAREGARYAIVHGATSSNHVATTDSVAAYVRWKTSLDSIRVTTTWSSSNSAGQLVTVRVEHDVPRRGPFIASHIDVGTSQKVITF